MSASNAEATDLKEASHFLAEAIICLANGKPEAAKWWAKKAQETAGRPYGYFWEDMDKWRKESDQLDKAE